MPLLLLLGFYHSLSQSIDDRFSFQRYSKMGYPAFTLQLSSLSLAQTSGSRGQVILKPSHAYYDEYYSYKGFVRHWLFFYLGTIKSCSSSWKILKPARSMLKNHVALKTCGNSATTWCREQIHALQEPLFSWSNLRTLDGWTQSNSGWYDSKSWSVGLVCAFKQKSSVFQLYQRTKPEFGGFFWAWRFLQPTWRLQMEALRGHLRLYKQKRSVGHKRNPCGQPVVLGRLG